MITLQTITGLLIAAVLNVLGTDQHEVAQVENEPVVKERTVADLHWFNVKTDGSFGAQIPNGEDDLPDLECESEEGITLCAVGLTDEEVDPTTGQPTIPSPDDAQEENKRYRDDS